MKYIATVGENEYAIDINDDEHVIINGDVFDINFNGLADTALYSLIMNGHSFDINIDEHNDLYQVMVKGILYDVKVEDERTRRLAGVKGALGEAVGEVLVKAPMPGVIVSVLVEEGQSVAKNDIVIILESMKMQNEFKSPKNGVVSSVRVQAGDKVDQNAVMLSVT